MQPEADEEEASRGVFASMKAHPVITSIMAGCALTGALLGFFLLPEEWMIVRRIAAGAVAGAGIGLTLTATKMIG